MEALLRGLQVLRGGVGALLERWPCHPRPRLAEVNPDAITFRFIPRGFEARAFMPQVIPFTHRRCDTRATRTDCLRRKGGPVLVLRQIQRRRRVERSRWMPCKPSIPQIFETGVSQRKPQHNRRACHH